MDCRLSLWKASASTAVNPVKYWNSSNEVIVAPFS